jgi:two-component system chemotaxis sensor kinase CheA
MKPSDLEFTAEAEDILSEAGSLLLDILDSDPSNPDPDAVNGLFRTMHTLKGMSGLYGHQGITDVSHALENILDMFRMGKADMDAQAVDFIFRQIDVLKGFVEEARSGKKIGEGKAASYLKEIEQFIGSAPEKKGSDPVKSIRGFDEILKVLSEYEEHRLRSNLESGNGIYKVEVVYSLEDFDVKLKDLTAQIKESSGEVISNMPRSEGVPAGSIGFTLVIGSSLDAAEMKGLTGKEAVAMVEPLGDSSDEATEPMSAEAEKSLKTSATMVRVDIGKLDRLLNTVGEVTLAKNNARILWQKMSDAYGKSPLVIELYKLVQLLERRLHELQGQVLDIRMVPVGQIFRRLGQVVRRYTRSSDKDISLEMFGEGTEIDKFIAEEIVDPLMHIVRNAIDHGIEPPDERRASGKSSAGRLQLKAFQRGNNVVIEVVDDGRGIDVEAIKEKAIESGLISDPAPQGDKEILELMFMPGFSTKTDVSETSGRGVGLDVAKEKLAPLGGFVGVETVPGRGTMFTLTLPAMHETFVFARERVRKIDGGDVVDIRGEMLPVSELNDIFQINGDGNEFAIGVNVGHGDKKACFIVDELLGQQEIVIKPLTSYLDGISGFAGAAEVGSNEVVLVLDAENLLSELFRLRAN